MNFTITDAQTLLTVCAALTPLLIMWMRALNWNDLAKFAVIILVCGVQATLTAYATGTYDSDASIIQNLAVIYLIAQGIYKLAFQSLGLERVLYPRAALVNLARSEVTNQVTEQSPANAKAVVNQSNPAKLVVTSEIVPNVSPPVSGVAEDTTKASM